MVNLHACVGKTHFIFRACLYPWHLLRHRPARLFLALGLLAIIGWGVAFAGLQLWAESHYRAAQEALKHYDYPKALEHLHHCLQVRSESFQTTFLAARTARRAQNLDEARQLLDRCEKLVHGQADLILFERTLLRAQTSEKEDFDKVERYLWACVEAGHAEKPLVLEALANGYLRMFRYHAAYPCLDMLLKEEPNHVPGLVWRAWLWNNLGNDEEGLKDLRRLVELDPSNGNRLRLGGMLIRQNLAHEALPHFDHLNQA